MLEFDTTIVRSTCDKNCYDRTTLFGREFMHSNSCVRRWRTERHNGTVTTESVRPAYIQRVSGSTRLSGVTLFNYYSVGICKSCGIHKISLCDRGYCNKCYQLK